MNDMNKKTKKETEVRYVMVSEPAPNLTVEAATILLAEIEKEQELADVFAAVDNKARWLEDNHYDFEQGTEEYRKACEISDQWFAVANELKEKIFSILREEGVAIPKRGQICVLKPFMERNGYFDGGGWWIPKDRAKTVI